MRRIASLYVGGPDAAMPDGARLLTEKRALCQAKGFVPVLPGEAVLVETEPSEAMAREIYADRVQRLREFDEAGLVGNRDESARNLAELFRPVHRDRAPSWLESRYPPRLLRGQALLPIAG